MAKVNVRIISECTMHLDGLRWSRPPQPDHAPISQNFNLKFPESGVLMQQRVRPHRRLHWFTTLWALISPSASRTHAGHWRWLLSKEQLCSDTPPGASSELSRPELPARPLRQMISSDEAARRRDRHVALAQPWSAAGGLPPGRARVYRASVYVTYPGASSELSRPGLVRASADDHLQSVTRGPTARVMYISPGPGQPPGRARVYGARNRTGLCWFNTGIFTYVYASLNQAVDSKSRPLVISSFQVTGNVLIEVLMTTCTVSTSYNDPTLGPYTYA